MLYKGHEIEVRSCNGYVVGYVVQYRGFGYMFRSLRNARSFIDTFMS